MGVGDGRMLDDRAQASFRGGGQIVAPRGWRDLLPLNELPPGLEALALGGVHKRLPSDVYQRPLRTVQAAGGKTRASRPSVSALVSHAEVTILR